MCVAGTQPSVTGDAHLPAKIVQLDRAHHSRIACDSEIAQHGQAAMARKRRSSALSPCLDAIGIATALIAVSAARRSLARATRDNRRQVRLVTTS
jgi:hypothetical protein